jgi:hypothetical protein
LVTRVIPRVEKVFRDEREAKLAIMKKDQDDSEKAGGGANRFNAARGAGLRNPADF